MKQCTKCRAYVDDKGEICVSCGARFTVGEDASNQALGAKPKVNVQAGDYMEQLLQKPLPKGGDEGG